MPSLAEIRQQYPQYEDMSDQQLADALYQRYYSDMPRAEFDQRVGFNGNAGPMTASGAAQMTQSSLLDPLLQGATFGLSDEINGLVTGSRAAVQGQDFWPAFEEGMGSATAALEAERSANPWGSLAAEVAGSIPTAMAGGGGLVARGGSLLSRAGRGLGVGAAQGAAYGAASQNDDRAGGALLGGAFGGAVGFGAPFAGSWLANRVRASQQGNILNQAARNAPEASELRTAASRLFEESNEANLSINREAFARLYDNIRNVTAPFRPNANLDPRATGALQVFQQVYNDVMAQGSNVVPDLRDLHMLRMAAQRAAVSSEGRDSAIANTIVRQVDEFIENLRPADIAGGADPSRATKALFDGIATWARANRVGVIEDAIERAQNTASGFENGLRIEFRKLLNNRQYANMFSDAERQAIQDVVRGTAGANLAKLLGWLGFGSGQASTGIGGAAGMALGDMAFGPVGMVIGPTLGAAGRAASERMTLGAANRALGAAATPGLQSIPPIPNAQATVFEQLLRRLGTPGAGQVANL